jgi:hypothetical protein
MLWLKKGCFANDGDDNDDLEWILNEVILAKFDTLSQN